MGKYDNSDHFCCSGFFFCLKMRNLLGLRSFPEQFGIKIDFVLFSKKKSYDGSDTLKMIGNDCKLMEQNIDSFLDVFVQDREQSWQSQKASSLRHVLKLYQLFTDIARYEKS